VPFESSGAVSYSHSIVTMVVYVAVCEIFSVKEWCDLQNGVRVHSRSLEMAPFNRSHTSSYSPSIWRYFVPFARYSDLLVENREFFLPHQYLADVQICYINIAHQHTALLTCNKNDPVGIS